MNYLVGFFILMAAAVVQSTLLSHLHFFGGTLDLVLVLTLGWTLAGDWQGGIAWGFMGGLFLDLLSGGPLGAAALGLTLMAYMASLTEGHFWRSHILLPLGTVMLGTLGFHGLYLIALAYSGYDLNWSASLAYVTLPTLVLNTLGMVPLYTLLRWLHAIVFPAPVTL